MTQHRQLLWLTGILLLSIIVLLCTPLIPQAAEYHNFADQRSLSGIPNFLNILSNLAFLLVGFAGIRLCLRRHKLIALNSWHWFFGAFALVGLGSGYYHWAPMDSTLVLDRLPMTLAFMSLFSVILNDSVLPNTERWLLPLLLVLGAASVIYWHFSGDLRLYAWVQFAPLLVMVFLLIAGPFRNLRRSYLCAALLAYVLAKVCEALDQPIYSATLHMLSGHTLKHLLAAASGYCLYRMLLSTNESFSARAV